MFVQVTAISTEFDTLHAFARDVLTIAICGLDCPQLTLVDLSALIHSENGSQSSDDVILVSEQVKQYIVKPRAFVLPSVSAKTDYANQPPSDSESEKSFVSLA